MSNLPPLPEPADTAYVEGPAMQGGEYRTLSDSYEPGCAMFSPEQMRAYAEEAVRLEREAKARAEQDEIVNAAIEWYGSSHKDEPEHRLAMAVLRFKTARARSQEGQG